MPRVNGWKCDQCDAFVPNDLTNSQHHEGGWVIGERVLCPTHADPFPRLQRRIGDSWEDLGRTAECYRIVNVTTDVWTVRLASLDETRISDAVYVSPGGTLDVGRDTLHASCAVSLPKAR